MAIPHARKDPREPVAHAFLRLLLLLLRLPLHPVRIHIHIHPC
jgi:hypothetical protein